MGLWSISSSTLTSHIIVTNKPSCDCSMCKFVCVYNVLETRRCSAQTHTCTKMILLLAMTQVCHGAPKHCLHKVVVVSVVYESGKKKTFSLSKVQCHILPKRVLYKFFLCSHLLPLCMCGVHVVEEIMHNCSVHSFEECWVCVARRRFLAKFYKRHGLAILVKMDPCACEGYSSHLFQLMHYFIHPKSLCFGHKVLFF